MRKISLPIAISLILILSSASGIFAGPVPDTGQTQSYTNTFGEDSDYLINPPSYTKLDANGNYLSDSATSWAMVRDNVTGLIWEVKQNKNGVADYSNPHDADNTYTWYDSNPDTNGGDAGTPGDGTDTEDFIKSLNAAKFGGYSDWRLPTVKELASIVNRGNYDPAVNITYFPNTVSHFYWSFTTHASSSIHAWFVSFGSGTIGYYGYNKSYSYYVRAVRASKDCSLDHLLINGDGTVTDTTTGLIWQTETAGPMNWESAISYCENLTLAGYNDWRLPNINELQSIVNYSKYEPSIDTTYFPETVTIDYWSSTTIAWSSSNAWHVYFTIGYFGYIDKSYSSYVRAVRAGQNKLAGNLYITFPKQASSWYIGDTMAITWEIQEMGGNVKVSLSRDGGKTYETIIDSTENDGSYEWTVTGPPSVNCMLKIEPIVEPDKGTVQGLFSIQNINLTNGLVAYYPFNGNANDESGNGNHGTVIGATLTTDRFGNADRAYSFAENYINVPYSESLNSSVFTISCWVSFYDLNKNHVILDKRNGQWNHSYALFYRANDSQPTGSPDNYLQIHIGDGTFHPSDYDNSAYAPVELTENKFYHIAATYDQTFLRLYLDGTKIAELAIDMTGNVGNGDLHIGTHGSVDVDSTYGIIDEVRIYNRALSEAEIQALYDYAPDSNSPPAIPSSPTPSNNATIISIESSLSWSGGDPDEGDTVTYDVYFGTSSVPPLVTSNLTDTSYDPGTLKENTTYYWKIVARDNHGAEAMGPVWSFTTQSKVATPTFSPAPGTYNSPQHLTISSSTDGATIYYTEDGSDPTQSSSIYSGPIEIPMDTTKTIKARGFKSDWAASDILKGTYTITTEQEKGTLAIHLKEGAWPEYYDVGNAVSLKGMFKDLDGNSADISIFLSWTSSDTDIAEVSDSGMVTFKAQGNVTITASGGGLIAQKNFQVGQIQQITKHYGNLIIVAGGGLSASDTLKNATQYLSNRMYQVFKMRGFEDSDIYYINPQPLQDLDGNGQNDGIVDSSTTTLAELQYAINWAAAQPNDGPLYIYLMDHGGDQTFKIGPTSILSATQLDTYLDEFESETSRETVLMIEACHSGTFINPLGDIDRLIITSANTGLAYLSPHGNVSFSQLFSTNLLKGMTWDLAFEEAKTQLALLGMPYNIQKPQIHVGDEIVPSYVGGEFVFAEFLPSITDYTKSKSVTGETEQDFSVTVNTLDVSGVSVWATVTPPLYQPPQITEEFETPQLGLDTFDLTNQQPSSNFTGTYSFTYNGIYKLTFYVKDKNNNVVSTPPIEISVTGGVDPSFESSIGKNWNLLSIPVVPGDSAIESVLANIKDNIVSAWKWTDDNWAVWIPESVMSAEELSAYVESKSFTLLKDIHCGEGFWVNSYTPQTLICSGIQPAATSCTLSTGWSLIGLKSNVAKTITDLISGNEDKIASIWKWMTSTWAVHLPGGDTGAYATSKGFSVLDQINPGEGFWVNCTETITLQE